MNGITISRAMGSFLNVRLKIELEFGHVGFCGLEENRRKISEQGKNQQLTHLTRDY